MKNNDEKTIEPMKAVAIIYGTGIALMIVGLLAHIMGIPNFLAEPIIVLGVTLVMASFFVFLLSI